MRGPWLAAICKHTARCKLILHTGSFKGYLNTDAKKSLIIKIKYFQKEFCSLTCNFTHNSLIKPEILKGYIQCHSITVSMVHKQASD